MKKLMKWLYATAIKFIESFIGLLSAILFSSLKCNKYFKNLKEANKGEVACYVFGAGPSLNDILQSEKCPKKNVFVVNHFALSPHFMTLKPDNYVVVDPIMCGSKGHESDKHLLDKMEEDYRIINNIDWKMNMFFPSDVSPKIVDKIKNNPNVNIIYFNKTPIDGYKGLKHFLFRKNLGMPLPQNVTNATIFCAINAGYKKVYLFGAEHSWTIDLRVNDKNQVCYYDDHFYDEAKSMRIIPYTDMTTILSAISRGFKSHLQLDEYAKSIGCEVINVTENSLVDAYRRMKVTEVLK